MAFDVISIVYISIFVLSVLVGLKRGFLKTLVSFIKGLGSFIAAVFLCKPLATLLTNSSLGAKMSVKMSDYFLAKGGVFTATVTNESKDLLLSNALEEINIPEFLHEFLSSLIVIPNEGSVNMANVLGISIAYYIFLGISFILLFLLGLIVMFLISKVFAAIEQIPFVGVINKVLGALVSGAMGLVVICFISYVITLIVPTGNELSNWLVETMRLNDSEVFTISKYFYENNFLVKLIAIIQKIFS